MPFFQLRLIRPLRPLQAITHTTLLHLGSIILLSPRAAPHTSQYENTVQNAAVHMLSEASRCQHITVVFMVYHTQFKVLVLIYKALYGFGTRVSEGLSPSICIIPCAVLIWGGSPLSHL